MVWVYKCGMRRFGHIEGISGHGIDMIWVWYGHSMRVF